MTEILLVGCGNMGFAMARGWMSGRTKPRVTVVEPNDALRARATEIGARAVASADALAGEPAPDFIVLAVKPQIMDKVLPTYAHLAEEKTVFVSVAAGLTIGRLETMTGPAPWVRTMPNTPAAIGQGMLAASANGAVPEKTRKTLTRLLKRSGEVVWVEENMMDAVTAISGSGPAYVFHFIEALTAAGKRLGLPAEIAATLARQTVAGSGAYAAAAGSPPNVLREQVTSPGGTTAAALDVLMGRLSPLIAETTLAARNRAVEIERETES